MEWRNQSQIEINEFGDRLEVIVRTQTGMLERIIFVALSVLAVFLFAKAIPIVGLLVAAIAVFSFINMLRERGEARLTVRSDAFVVEDGRAKRQSVSTDDIYGIGYFGGGEDEPIGLYAFRPLSRICLTPNLDEAESQRIKFAIESKFPEMQFGKEPLSGLFDGPEIIALGLNRPDAADSDHSMS